MEMEQNTKYLSKTDCGGGSATCPPGLEYLAQIDSLTVSGRKYDIGKIPRRVKFQYELKNAWNQNFMFAHEDYRVRENSPNLRGRSFHIDVTDNYGQKVLWFKKEFRSCGGCCWFADSCNCAFVMTTELPSGVLLGVVRQAQTPCKLAYHILNGDHQPILYIEDSSPCFCVRWDFKVYTLDRKHTIGSVTRLFKDFTAAMEPEADLYEVSFPMDLDVKAKATLIGATFMIECSYFEQARKSSSYSGPGFVGGGFGGGGGGGGGF